MKRYLLLMFLLLAPATFAQQQILPFTDDLLDHFVGRWEMTGTVHGRPSKQTFQVDWVLNHQFLRIREKSEESIAGTNLPFEALLFIGYDKTGKRYVLHSMSVFGAGRPGEFVYGQRTGNELKFTESREGKVGHSRFIWQPESATWRYITGIQNAAGELMTTVNLESAPAK